jgi:hypothetical protein
VDVDVFADDDELYAPWIRTTSPIDDYVSAIGCWNFSYAFGRRTGPAIVSTYDTTGSRHISNPGAPSLIHYLRRIVRLGNWAQLRAQILIRDHLVGVGRLRLFGARLTRHVSHGLVLCRRELCRNQGGCSHQGDADRFSDFLLSRSSTAPSCVPEVDLCNTDTQTGNVKSIQVMNTNDHFCDSRLASELEVYIVDL